MKTSIVYRSYHGNYGRCRAPSDPVQPGEEKKASTISFVPAHTSEGYSFDPSTLKTGPKHEMKRPDTLYCGSVGFHFKRGRAEQVRIMPQDCVRQLEEIDRQIIDLERRRRELLEESYLRSSPVTIKEARAWREARMQQMKDKAQSDVPSSEGQSHPREDPGVRPI